MQTGGFLQQAVSLLPIAEELHVLAAEINGQMIVRWIFSLEEYTAGTTS